MTSKYIVIVFLLGLVLLTSCNEDTIQPQLFGSIEGQVLRKDDLTPLSNVAISTTPTSSSVITDIAGNFTLENILIGTYSIRAEREGFVIKQEGVTVTGNSAGQVVIRMEKDTSISAPPTTPQVISPLDGAQDQSVNIRLEWISVDEDEEDILLYDLYLYEDQQSDPILEVMDISDNFLEVTDLQFGKNYYWQVSAKDGRTAPVFSMLWRFKTEEFPDYRFLFAREIDGKYDIYSANDLGDEIKLTDNNASNWRPIMSPNRDKIAFISNAGIDLHIYVMNRDGSNITQVTTLPISGLNSFELDFSWSPDGTQILYMRNSILNVINTDGTGLSVLTEAPPGTTFVECDWVGSGNKILVRTLGNAPYASNIWLLESNGAFVDTVIPDLPGSTGGGVFSIPGTKILYTQDISGFNSITGRQLNARVFQVDINSGVRVDLSYEKVDGTNDLDARYSPDGAKIIFTNTNNDGISQKNIYIMDLDGDNRALLFENAEMPEWK